MPLLRFIAGRLVKGVIVLIAIATMNFFLIRAAPGDPASVLAGEAGAADEEFLRQLREQFGLDQPIMTQLWIYLTDIITLDLEKTSWIIGWIICQRHNLTVACVHHDCTASIRPRPLKPLL